MGAAIKPEANTVGNHMGVANDAIPTTEIKPNQRGFDNKKHYFTLRYNVFLQVLLFVSIGVSLWITLTPPFHQ